MLTKKSERDMGISKVEAIGRSRSRKVRNRVTAFGEIGRVGNGGGGIEEGKCFGKDIVRRGWWGM
jgi:hypothetical protein